MLVKKKSGPRIFKLTAKIFLALSFIGGLFYIFYSAPFLKIVSIEVIGDGMPKEELYSILGKRVVGENIFFWKPKNSSESAKLSIRLSKFSIEKDYLNRKIIVEIAPREKEMVWCYEKEDSCFWVDNQGLIFEKSARLSGNLIYSVNELKAETKNIGESVMDRELFNTALMIIQIIEGMSLPISSIVIEDAKLREMVVEPINGPRIIFGLNINPDFTKTAIDSFRKSGWGNIKEINLTVYGRAYASF